MQKHVNRYLMSILFLQTTAAREARAEASGLKEEVENLQKDMRLAARQLDAEREQGQILHDTYDLVAAYYLYNEKIIFAW